MTVRGGSWSTHQLAEFVAAVSTLADEQLAVRSGVERVAEALDADAVALMYGAELGYSVGWPALGTPTAVIRAAVLRTRELTVPVPGLGEVPITIVPVGELEDTQLVMARGGDPLDVEERALLRAMARTLGLAMLNHQVVAALRERQRLLEGLSEIQRSIALRAPLGQVLQIITQLAHEILGDDQAVVFLRDHDDPQSLVLAAESGRYQEFNARARRRRVGEGAGGRAVVEDRLVVVERYDQSSGAMPLFVARGVTGTMAAPVHVQGEVAGTLMVTSLRPGRRYTSADQALMLTIAQQVSLALTDARIVDDMVHQALHDPLTGLPNRTLLGDRLNHALDHSERTGVEITVLFVDLDRFKPVNDSLGHAAGDEVLRVVAARISNSLREHDTAARLGGDEFAVLLEDLTTKSEARLLAQRIIDSICAPITVKDREIFIGASVGIAAGRRGEDLLREADLAMYQAKAAGRGRFAVYEPEMQGEAVGRLELEAQLRHALDRHELELHYQPIVELATGLLRGVEVLLRWNHPEQGMIAPASFIPIAEETGLINEIGRWVLETACLRFTAWQRAGAARDLCLNVNISGRQLERPELLELVAATVNNTGIERGALVLEINEAALTDAADVTIARLHAIRELGVRIAVDDFGGGYQLLRYLDDFPVDVLKMARPFVESLDTANERSSLAQAIVNLGWPVVAVGVEHPRQCAALLELGCELGQGYHFGKPMPAAEIEALIL